MHILVDWNSELRSPVCKSLGDGPQTARSALKYVCRRVGKLLQQEAADEAFFLFLRIYHGWRTGSLLTARRRFIEEARIFNPTNPEDKGLVEYSPHPMHVVRELEFGDRLLGARDVRLCGPQLDHHLPSTYQQDRSGKYGEKMVDTALVADLLHLATEEDRSWIIVVGQDADLVPGILTAEGMIYGTDRRVFYLARGGIKNSNPRMTDLICRR